ncbi:MAG: helix-turn-helix transcriptional regulator [Promethearchaeota archaeon]
MGTIKFKKRLVSRVKELREAQNLSQQELANLVGVSRQTIYFLEKGAYNPSLTLSFRLAETFNKTIEEIFYFEPEIKSIIGKLTLDDSEEISRKIGMGLQKLIKLKNLNDEELTTLFSKEELLRLTGILGLKFDDYFIEDE